MQLHDPPQCHTLRSEDVSLAFKATVPISLTVAQAKCPRILPLVVAPREGSTQQQDGSCRNVCVATHSIRPLLVKNLL